MHGIWRAGSFPEEVWVTPAFGAELPAEAVEIAPASAAFQVEAWFGESGQGRQILAEIAEQLGAPLIVGPRMPTARLREHVREALQRGDLRAYRIKVKLSGAPAAKLEASTRPPEEKAEEKTFVVIELVDDADPPRPVAFEKYRIELPDHSVREGMLDENGRAELRDIDPGTCTVTFPKLLREDWWLT
jgi:hypothetical protein